MFPVQPEVVFLQKLALVEPFVQLVRNLYNKEKSSPTLLDTYAWYMYMYVCV